MPNPVDKGGKMRKRPINRAQKIFLRAVIGPEFNLSTECEKSPGRSSRVGTLPQVTSPHGFRKLSQPPASILPMRRCEDFGYRVTFTRRGVPGPGGVVTIAITITTR